MMTDLWSYLKEQRAPILMYGMGNGGDKLLGVCRQKGIEISGVFASDGFARGNLFHGMKVMTYSEAKEVFGSFIVLVAFATSREEVLQNILRIGSEQQLFVPDLPVIGENLFDLDFYLSHKEAFDSAREILADEKSKNIFDLIIKAKLSGTIAPLFEETSSLSEDFEELLSPESYTLCGDFGAYTGDTALDLLGRVPAGCTILAAEPDPKTFSKLQRNTEGLAVKAVHGAIWKEDTTLLFTASGGRGAGLGAVGKKTVEVPAFCADTLFEKGTKVDYLKFDVEGAEFEALLGCRRILAEDRPQLLLSCYHRPEDLFKLPLYLKKEYPFYKLYLRRHKGIPAWDINLYAIPQ